MFCSLSRFEKSLWLFSVLSVTLAFVLSGSGDVFTLTASLIGVTAAAADPGCIAMAVCFAVFFLNDSYGFVNWHRMMRRQQS